jgi:mannose/cellobiose epimerase-like protein (N-acyl-D-glucosamine 2-epimerase family)
MSAATHHRRADGRTRMTAFSNIDQARTTLKSWLVGHAYPLWWSLGADMQGGFHERLHQNGTPTNDDRRSRLHPRQIYAFSLARQLAWEGPADTAVRHALSFYLQRYRRQDHLFSPLPSPNDGPALLYDQAFALLGLASACKVLPDRNLYNQARQLLSAIRGQFGHTHGGFEETVTGLSAPISNSHMHLLEAALAWIEHEPTGVWHDLAEDIVKLAATRFTDPGTGFLLEFFDDDWRPIQDSSLQRVEPGHQFEWAWLLLRWSVHSGDTHSRALALQLIRLAETHGVDRMRHVAINALAPDGTVRDANARLWPQTERLKAAALAAELTRDNVHWAAACEAANVLAQYLDVPLQGLWRDTMTESGAFIDEPAPASSMYHIVGAIAQLDRSAQHGAPDARHTACRT